MADTEYKIVDVLRENSRCRFSPAQLASFVERALFFPIRAEDYFREDNPDFRRLVAQGPLKRQKVAA